MTANFLEVLGFLQLLASYELASAFDADELMVLLASVANDELAPELCCRLGFANRAGVPILKKYLKHIEGTANGLLKKETKSQKEEAVDQKVAPMRVASRFSMDHKLESEYSPRIIRLLAQKGNKGFTALESQDMPKGQQVEVNQISPEGASAQRKALSAGPNSSKTSINCPQPMTVILANMKGKELLFFLKEHINEIGLFCCYISSALKLSNDSAELVLDAIKGLYDSMHQEETEDEANSKWRSCILLLQQLMILSPDIRPEIKERARKLAGDLKERIKSGTKNLFVALGFLLFIDTYGLAPSLEDTNELLSFYENGSHDRLVAKLCQAPGISKKISVSSLPLCISEVSQSSLENFVVNNRIDSTSMVSGLDVIPFSNVMDAKGREHNSISGDPSFICKASDPASLVLDALLSCYYSMYGKSNSVKLVARSFFQLLQELMRVLPEIKPDIRDKATKFYVDWKAKWHLHLTGQRSPWEALAFLQLIATYKVPSSFNVDELHVHQDAACQPKEAIALFRILELVDKIPSIISNLIKKKRIPLALTFIYEFKLVGKFPPVPLLKNHILYFKKLGEKKCNESRNTAEAQDKAIIIEISAVKTVIRCIQKYGLETEFPTDELRNQIAELQHKRMSLKNLTQSRSSSAEKQQPAAADEIPSAQLQQGMKEHSALSAGIVKGTQPLPALSAGVVQGTPTIPSAELPQEGMKKRSALSAGIVHGTQPSPALSARIVQGTQTLPTKCARLSY